MNILPKKRWHVRTKENIARVRKDEAEAAEKERLEKLRIETADREARLNILKQKSTKKLLDSGISQSVSPKLDHINFFENLDNAVKTTNKEHDNEVKSKQEEYEKKIGYLTYLGQDTNEALGKKNWYEVLPSSRITQVNVIKDTYDKLLLKDVDDKVKARKVDEKDGEIAWKAKQYHDPINAFKKHCQKIDGYSQSIFTEGSCKNAKVDKHKISKKHENRKKNKESKGEKEEKLKKLREARLKREQQEKYKTELFLGSLNAPSTSNNLVQEQNVNKIKPKYNSQFNPELARQNYR